MLSQPPIIALLLASAANVAMVVGVAPYALGIVRDWDVHSGSERQLTLERRTYLMSTLVTFVLAVQLVAVLLFVFNADRMASLFIGAMCAVGTLNVNPYGFPSLITQIAVFFAASTWLAMNHLDTQAPDYPLVRTKYVLLLGLAPLLIAAFVLEWRYFSGLQVDVITSCCARIFTRGARGLSGDLAALPPLPAMIVFYGAVLLAMTVAGYASTRKRGGYAMALTSVAAFVATITGVIAFLSPYVYEQPHHHCPFCLLKREYGFLGYWLYVPLFVATASGLAAGAIEPFAGVPSLRGLVPVSRSRLARAAAVGFALVAAVATVIILHSNLVLIGSIAQRSAP